MPVKRAFEAYANQRGVKASSIQAAYYQHKNELKPVEPESLSDRLRTLVSEVQDLEELVDKYEALRDKHE